MCPFMQHDTKREGETGSLHLLQRRVPASAISQNGPRRRQPMQKAYAGKRTAGTSSFPFRQVGGLLNSDTPRLRARRGSTMESPLGQWSRPQIMTLSSWDGSRDPTPKVE